MTKIYEYRTFRIERGSWRRLIAAASDAATTGDGAMFALFAGIIGFATDEGALMRAWSDGDGLAARAQASAAFGFIESSVDRLAPTARPLDATPPREPGVYAHRWFWLQAQDWPEFVSLSEEGVWPYFEADGCRIVGLWRSIDAGSPARALLITRYDSVSHWERTRVQSEDAPSGVDERLYRAARDAVRRRAELTERSIVRLTRLAAPLG
jgi:hypothetical protein